jgi:hypothetical protein
MYLIKRWSLLLHVDFTGTENMLTSKKKNSTIQIPEQQLVL